MMGWLVEFYKSVYNKQMGNLFQREQSPAQHEDDKLSESLARQRFSFDIHRMVKVKTCSIRNQYNIISPPIGQGTFGRVYKARHKLTDIFRSVKTVRNRAQTGLLQEYEVLRSLDHPHILKLYEIYIDGEYYSLVTDYYDGGSLRSKISELKTLNQYQAAIYMQQVLMAVAYMHSKGFMHCDLKPQNILLDKTQKHAKVIDFGLSRKIDHNTCQEKGLGTEDYFAPEVEKGVIVPKSDIWSCGVILLVMLTGRIPCSKQLHEGTFKLDQDFSCLLSNSVKDLIFLMISPNIHKRISAEEALNHQWFRIQEHQRESPLNPTEIERCLCNMKQYLKFNRLQCLFLSIIANFILSQEDKMKQTQVFLQCDKNKDGVISIAQLKSSIQSFCPQKYKCVSVEKVFLQLDKNESKELDLREFLACSIDPSVLFQDIYIHQAFSDIDTNRNNVVTVQEFSEYINDLVPDHGIQEELIRELDIDKDGNIDLPSFTSTLKQISKSL